jgi:DNA repair exonuclease SbcCD ATPase subunit
MAEYSTIIEKIRDKQSLRQHKLEDLNAYIKDRSKMIEERDRLENLKEKLDNLVYTCKLILEKITYNSKHKLEQFLTYAFQNIFADRHYAIELVLKEDTKKPGLELTLVENGQKQEITESVGGGIISTLGLLMQIYFIEVYKLNKIMFIDEGLKEVSADQTTEAVDENYLKNVLGFLSWLAEEKEYKFVIVTHDTQVKDFASKVYEVKNGVVSVC